MLPDEGRYWYATEQRVPVPFHYRWLLPAVCGQRPRVWLVVQAVSLVALCGLTAAYAGAWWAALLPLGLSGLMVNLRHPILVDLPAMALALGAAVAWDHHLWWLALVLACVAGMVKETGPVFAALYAWTPILLVGLVPVAIRALMAPGPDPVPDGPAAEALRHPVRVAWEHHRKLARWAYVLPWGVLLAGLVNGSPQLWATLAAAYLLLIVTTDCARIVVWAFPVLVAAAVPVLTGPALLLALVLHAVNPFRTDGI